MQQGTYTTAKAKQDLIALMANVEGFTPARNGAQKTAAQMSSLLNTIAGVIENDPDGRFATLLNGRLNTLYDGINTDAGTVSGEATTEFNAL